MARVVRRKADEHRQVMEEPSKGFPWKPEHLRLAIEAAGVALWSWNVDTDELTMDQRAFALLGRSAQRNGATITITGQEWVGPARFTNQGPKLLAPGAGGLQTTTIAAPAMLALDNAPPEQLTVFGPTAVSGVVDDLGWVAVSGVGGE